MLTRQQKEQVIKDLSDKIVKMKSVVFFDFTGMNVSQMNALRKELKNSQSELKVVKKTLIDLALKKNKLEVDLDQYKTQLAVVFGYNDELMPIKVLDRFVKENKALKMLIGIIGKDYIGADVLSSLAKLPPREELLSKLIGTISAPVSGLVNVFRGNARGLVQVLSQIKK